VELPLKGARQIPHDTRGPKEPSSVSFAAFVFNPRFRRTIRVRRLNGEIASYTQGHSHGQVCKPLHRRFFLG